MPEFLPESLTARVPTGPGPEEFITLAEANGARVERIVSRGTPSPEGFWYDQPNDEWVMLVQGEALLEFEGGATSVWKAGDCGLIRARVRHRVARVSADAVWLAVHFPPQAPAPSSAAHD